MEDVLTYEELEAGAGGDAFREAYAHSFHADRGADLVIRFKENYLRRPTGEPGTRCCFRV